MAALQNKLADSFVPLHALLQPTDVLPGRCPHESFFGGGLVVEGFEEGGAEATFAEG